MYFLGDNELKGKDSKVFGNYLDFVIPQSKCKRIKSTPISSVQQSVQDVKS